MMVLCDNRRPDISGGDAKVNKLISLSLVCTLSAVVGCEGPAEPSPPVEVKEAQEVVQDTNQPRPDVYAEFSLGADLSALSAGQRQMLVLFIEASQIMDDLFWRQAYGDDYPGWLASIGVDETRRFAELNYGPWDRLDDEAPFMEGAGEKPLGARFYPADMSKEDRIRACYQHACLRYVSNDFMTKGL